MKYVKLNPPGTWCMHDAVLQLIKTSGANTFIEVGCGTGDLSARLCDLGLKGVGIDFSEDAILQSQASMKRHLDAGTYKLVGGDILSLSVDIPQADIVISLLVIEHIEDQHFFLHKLKKLIKPGGHIILGVPGRKDCWGIEDETVGHLRRYDRVDLLEIFSAVGFYKPTIWSLFVPFGNILHGLSNYLISKSDEMSKKKLTLKKQTQLSGVRSIPFKTVFPVYFKLLLNPYVLYPFFLIQRLFFNTNLGLTMLAFAKKPKEE